MTLIIIAITCVFSFLCFNRPELKYRFMMNPYRVSTQQQYYRMLTSGFIHQDHIHLLFNMLALYFFGPYVEQIFEIIFGQRGTPYFVAFYLIAIVVSDLPTFLKHRHNPAYNSLGASGAVASVIFAFIMFAPLEEICLYFVICLPGFILGIIYIIYSYYQGKRGGDNINHNAHLYGALFGILFCIVFHPSVIRHFVDQIMNWTPSFF